jgi:hypothetical protein
MIAHALVSLVAAVCRALNCGREIRRGRNAVAT